LTFPFKKSDFPMKNGCSVANMVAGSLGLLRNAGWIALGVPAFFSALVAALSAAFYVMGEPFTPQLGPYDRLLYAASALSWVILLTVAIRKNGLAASMSALRPFGFVVGGILCLGYGHWVLTRFPAVNQSAFAVFSLGHTSLLTRLAMIPAQLAVIAACAGLLCLAGGLAWMALESLCEYGAAQRATKAAKA
jgi:hypothetical protein